MDGDDVQVYRIPTKLARYSWSVTVERPDRTLLGFGGWSSTKRGAHRAARLAAQRGRRMIDAGK